LTMRTTVLLASASLCIGSPSGPASPTYSEFLEWASRQHKSYSSSELRNRAFETWQDNVIRVAEINNAPDNTWVATIENQFGDLTPKEFADTILSRPFSPPSNTHHSHKNSRIIEPTQRRGKQFLMKNNFTAGSDSFDWASVGAVTGVHDQGSVGTCWAFSTIGNIESQWFFSTNELVDLSEEFLVDCDGSRDDAAGRADCGVFGGWPYLAYQFIINTGGVPTEATNPYCCGTGDCYPCMNGPVSLCGPPPYYCDKELTAACPNASLHATISSWQYISDNEDEMKVNLAEVGPLSALLDATQLQYYKSGVWTGISFGPAVTGCTKTSLNHAIVVTGYGVDGSTPYWTVKNSWGSKWGESGYFRIARGQGTCGINTEVTTSRV